MYKNLIIALLMNICFPAFMIGIDISSEAAIDGDSEDLDNGFSITFEGDKTSSGLRFGLEYLFPTELDDPYIDAEVSMMSIYAKYDFSEKDDVILSGIIGYSKLDLEYDSDYQNIEDIDGGMMFGIQCSFNNILFSYSIHQGEISVSDSHYYYYYYVTEDYDLDLNRFTVSYSF